MKNYLILVSVFVALTFPSCVKYEKPAPLTFRTVGLTDRIEITDVVGDCPAISEVAFVARFHMPPGVWSSTAADPAGADARIMLRVPFSGKGTRLILPEKPPQSLLRNIGNDIPEGFEISDPDANTISFTEIACDMAGSGVSGHLSMGRTVDDMTYELQFVYCDRPVTITGAGEDWWGHSTIYDLKLEKGWNQVVELSEWSSYSRIQTVTNWMPSGMEWKYSVWL